MSLIEELRGIEGFPASHEPVTGDVLEVVGKLIAYVEHGDELLKAADQDAQARQAGQGAYNVNDLLAPPSDEDLAARAAAPGGAPDQRDAEIAQLRQQLATAQAQQQRTTVDVAGEPDSPPAVPPGPAPAEPPQPEGA